MIPINIYGSQWVGNEAFAGCLTSVVLVMCFSLIRSGPSRSRWFLPVLGLVLGLAILSKMTAIMLAPPIFALLIYMFKNENKPARRVLSGMATVFAVTFVIPKHHNFESDISITTEVFMEDY